jgi:hypothetical protein
MPFRPSDANLKLRAPDDIIAHYAITALDALNREGAIYKIFSQPSMPIPDQEGFLFIPSKNHFQGVAIRDGFALVTTSAEGGAIVSAKGHQREFLLDGVEPTDGFEHPGGVQTIGSYLVVPVYAHQSDDRRAEIQFYKYGPQIELVEHLTIKRDGKRLYCLGITDCTGLDGDYYVLAVVSHHEGHVIDFYRTEPGIPLSDHRCSFVKQAERHLNDHTPYKTWHYETIQNHPQHVADWQPDRNWGGYPNSVSLLADAAGQVYFLGLHRSDSGRDWADLFLLNLDATEERMLTKLAHFHAIAQDGASFRWAGSALVTSETTLSIFTCARNAENDNQELILNVFHANNDPLFGRLNIVV